MTFQHATYETAEVDMGVALTTHLVGPPQDQYSDLGINEMKKKKFYIPMNPHYIHECVILAKTT